VELNLTQSAVSRQILQLEEMLDVALFDRVRQRVVITAAGKLYLKDIHRLLIDFEDSTNRIMACGGSSSLLNLAVLPTFATQWLVPRLPRFLKKNPEATVNFSTRISPFDFSIEPFDAAIHYGSPSWPGAVSHHLMDEDTVAVCSPKYEAAERIRKPADLARVVLLHQATRATAWTGWFETFGIEPTHPMRGPRFEQFGMISQAAVYGIGVALLPRLLVEDELRSGKLVVLFSHSVQSAHSYFLVVPENKVSTPLTAAFTRWIVSEAKVARE
jgi:LysR family glycine cleavage system transcriptional activator